MKRKEKNHDFSEQMQQCFRPDLTLKTQTKNKNSIIKMSMN